MIQSQFSSFIFVVINCCCQIRLITVFSMMMNENLPVKKSQIDPSTTISKNTYISQDNTHKEPQYPINYEYMALKQEPKQIKKSQQIKVLRKKLQNIEAEQQKMHVRLKFIIGSIEQQLKKRSDENVKMLEMVETQIAELKESEQDYRLIANFLDRNNIKLTISRMRSPKEKVDLKSKSKKKSGQKHKKGTNKKSPFSLKTLTSKNQNLPLFHKKTHQLHQMDVYSQPNTLRSIKKLSPHEKQKSGSRIQSKKGHKKTKTCF